MSKIWPLLWNTLTQCNFYSHGVYSTSQRLSGMVGSSADSTECLTVNKLQLWCPWWLLLHHKTVQPIHSCTDWVSHVFSIIHGKRQPNWTYVFFFYLQMQIFVCQFSWQIMAIGVCVVHKYCSFNAKSAFSHRTIYLCIMLWHHCIRQLSYKF